MALLAPIETVILGLGRSGWDIHARLIEQLPHMFKIVAVADPLEARRQEAQARFNCSSFSSVAATLAGTDAELAVIATPTDAHLEDALAALETGLNVVCEKPLVQSAEDADRLIATAETAGRHLSVFHNMRYSPDYRKVREVIASGVLGDLLQIRLTGGDYARRSDWQALSGRGGGALNNRGSHLIDLVLQFTNDPQPEIFCVTARALTRGDAEDHIRVIIQPRNGPTLDVEFSHAMALPQERWRVSGTLGALAGDAGCLRWRHTSPDTLPDREVTDGAAPDRSYPSADEVEWTEQQWCASNTQREAQLDYYRELHDSLRMGEPLPIPATSARTTVAVVERCRLRAHEISVTESGCV